MKVRPGAVVRGAGVAVACLAPDPSKRSPILIGGFTGAWFLNKPGLRIFTIIPATDEPWKRTTVPFATSVTLWSGVMLSAITALRRTRLPVPISAVMLGGVLTVVDSVLADLGEARDAREATETTETAKATETTETAQGAQARQGPQAAGPEQADR